MQEDGIVNRADDSSDPYRDQHQTSEANNTKKYHIETGEDNGHYDSLQDSPILDKESLERVDRQFNNLYNSIYSGRLFKTLRQQHDNKNSRHRRMPLMWASNTEAYLRKHKKMPSFLNSKKEGRRTTSQNENLGSDKYQGSRSASRQDSRQSALLKNSRPNTQGVGVKTQSLQKADIKQIRSTERQRRNVPFSSTMDLPTTDYDTNTGSKDDKSTTRNFVPNHNPAASSAHTTSKYNLN